MGGTAHGSSRALGARVSAPVTGLLHWFDDWQTSHRGTRLVCAVVKRFGEDRGGSLAALITFYAFLSLFPLLLLATTVLGFVLHGHPGLRTDVERSVLAQFPLIGQDLRGNTLQGSAVAVAVGSIGLVWGSLGGGQAIEFAANEVWHVPNPRRPGFFPRLGRALVLYGVIGLAVGVTAVLTTVVPLGVWLALVMNCALCYAVLKILGPSDVTRRARLPAAIVGGVGWQLVQIVGTTLVDSHLRHMTELYGQFAIVLGAISILTLLAQLFVYVVELSAVLQGHEWPRRLFD